MPETTALPGTTEMPATTAPPTRTARHRTRRVGVLLTVTATTLLAAAGPALADTGPPTDQPPITVTLTPEQSERLCEEGVPRLLERLAGLEARLGADAGTVGSTAWLEERLAVAEAAGRTERAERLRDRLDRRDELPAVLDRLESRVTGFRDAHCVA